ncbi:hypothetical protein ADL29_04525 [Streptomyces chattanoogensis]|uniref:Uncharacterized protein n=1 Tax=Streptomyces chattanoogensis TaxID=66876 RepID=A0A0N0H3F9_9ACTN|nr:hypothetical protein ADL29_04525 [Streptomyces chattanoogensis]
MAWAAGWLARPGESAGAVAGAVVRDDAFDVGDAVGCEPGSGPVQEHDGGVGFLVGQRFGVGKPAESVDGGVKVDVAAACALAFTALDGLGLVAPASVDSPTTAFRDPADLLHVDVHHVSGTAGGDLPRFPVRVAAGIDEPAPVQAEGEQMP